MARPGRRQGGLVYIQHMYNEATEDALSFDWDEANIEHISRHDVKPEEAEQALMNEPVEFDYDVVENE